MSQIRFAAHQITFRLSFYADMNRISASASAVEADRSDILRHRELFVVENVHFNKVLIETSMVLIR